MKFCPICSNCLIVENSQKGFQFNCKTCNYFFPIDRKIKVKQKMQTKQIDDILGGAQAWENVDSI